jgi:hypothetical protein
MPKEHVGYFTAAGGGYTPPEFLRDTDAHQAAVAAILAMPATTTPRFAPELDARAINEWRLVAERGLFAYNSDTSGGPHQLLAAPEAPVLATALPAAVMSVLDNLVYRDLRFATLTTIYTEPLLRPPVVERRFFYVVWFHDRRLRPGNRSRERSFAFVVVTTTAERAKEWGDELVRRYLARHPELELARCGVTIAHARTDYDRPSVRYGEDESWDW